MEHVNWVKGVMSAAIAALTALWGWFGWLIVLWVCLMAVDYLTGSAVAMRSGKWASSAARDGIWHKAGSIIIVIVAGGADLLIGMILGHLPGVVLPWDYTVLICPLVVVWYILTEAGSIVENAVKLGSRCPPWLEKILDTMRDAVDQAGDIGKDNNDEDHRK